MIVLPLTFPAIPPTNKKDEAGEAETDTKTETFAKLLLFAIILFSACPTIPPIYGIGIK
jgi:hypothetical protein